MNAKITDLAAWKAAHARPVAIDYCRWNQALETAMRANMDALFTLAFIWPRVLLRTVTGV